MSAVSKLLIDLYNSISKHSGYQLLHPCLSRIIPPENGFVKSRYEQERLDYISERLNLSGQRVADVGGNTGFFTFASIEHGAKWVNYYDGNATHAKFVQTASAVLGLKNKINVFPLYLDLEKSLPSGAVDVVLLLNVLHHIGDDYDMETVFRQDVSAHVKMCLHSLARQTRFVVFQLGFNWKGDISLPLFANGTKKEMINFVGGLCDGYWKICNIGIPEQVNGKVEYREMSELNTERNDVLGEFLNRPIFVLESLLLK